MVLCMTDYVWRKTTKESVIKKPVTRSILLIIKKSSREKWFTTTEIYNEGKQKRIPGFPTSKTTILRALNSMSSHGIDILEKKEGLKGQAHHWRLIKSPFLFEELIVENEINTLKDISKRCFSNGKMECNYNNIIGDESVTIYGFPSHFSTISSNLLQQWKTSDKEFYEIITRMKKDMGDLYELAVRRRLYIFYEKVAELFHNPYNPWGWEKYHNLYNRHANRNKNIFEILKDPELMEAFLKVGRPSEEDVSSLDIELVAVFLYCLIFEQPLKWFDLQKTSIAVKADIQLIEVFRDLYPSKKDEIWGMLRGHEIDRELSEKLRSLVDFYNHLFPIHHLIAVMHGGSADKRELSSSDLCQLADIIDSKHTKAYRRLSKEYRSEKMKVTPDEILDGITR